MSVTTLLVGMLFVVASVWWITQGSITYLGHSWSNDIVTILNGIIPPLIFIVGLFVLWLELDHLKASSNRR